VHVQNDISDIYLLAKKTTGVFVNIALQEPFGLTLIEAAVHGCPIVATTHGGPVDIIKTLEVRSKFAECFDLKSHCGGKLCAIFRRFARPAVLFCF
jgi:glycosyltransferase involved in cell wall biosynthesis